MTALIVGIVVLVSLAFVVAGVWWLTHTDFSK
jgi:hypothetical protein